MITWLLLLLLSVWFIYFKAKRRNLYKLASVLPKPQGELPLLGMLHLFTGNSEDTMARIQKLSYEAMQFNGIIRVWFGPLLLIGLTNPIDMEMILKFHLEKEDYLHRFLKSVVGNGIVFAPVPVWRRRRKVMTPLFSPKKLEYIFDVIERQSEGLVKVLEPKANGHPFKILTFFSRYTLDSIYESLTGAEINTLHNKNSEFFVAINRLFELVFERLTHPWLSLDWMYRLFPQFREHRKCMDIVTGHVNQVIKKRRMAMRNANKTRNEADHCRDMDECRLPFIDLLIHSSGYEKGYSDLELQEEILTMLMAGMDTSAITVNNVLILLAKYPVVQQKVYEDLYQVFKDSDRSMTKKDLADLKYMECVIKETQRLLPPGPIIVRKTMVDVVLPSGSVLPAGAGIVCSIFGAHRDPAYWGTDSEHFDPGRFLPNRFNLAHACSYLPFSFGPRGCILSAVFTTIMRREDDSLAHDAKEKGYQYAMMSMKTALAAVLRRYQVVGEEESGPAPSLTLKLDITMRTVDDYQIGLKKRNRVLAFE